MTTPKQSNINQSVTKTSDLKNWVILVLTFIFVALYAAALIGWLKPLSDTTVISRLEPLIFVIIGYYFGRLPATQNEETLKEEIDRQTQKATAAQHIKEQAQQEREALEERIKSVNTILSSVSTQQLFKTSATDFKNADETINYEFLQHSITTAIKILNS